MTTAAFADPGMLDLADGVIRETVRRAHFPPERLLAIAREVIEAEQSSAAAWELAVLQGEQAKPRIESRSGDPLKTEQVAKLLGVSDETVRTRARLNQLLAYPATRGKGLRFPRWQFVPEASRSGHTVVAPWVAPVLAAYGHNGWGLLDFLTVPRDHLQGRSYHALLQTEDGAERVIEAAHRSNPE